MQHSVSQKVRACRVAGIDKEVVAKMVDPKSLRKEDANLLQATRHPAVSASSKPWLIAMLVVLPQNEMRIWSRVNHPNCVRLLAVCLECVLAVRHTCRVLWWTVLGVLPATGPRSTA